jgi:hypothetical protein
MDKEEFHWLFGVMQGWFSANLGSKITMMAPGCQDIFSGATNSHRDITNRNQPLLFFHMDPTNSIVWTRENFIGSLVSCRVGFQQNLGQKSVMDPSCQDIFWGHQQVIIFSVLDFLGSGFWEKKNFPEPCATRFFKINEARRIK